MKDWREELHREDGFSRKLQSPVLWIVIACIIVLVIGGFVSPAIQRLKTRPHVVVYTSQDKVYSEALFKLFTQETGIDVRAVYDAEAVKTVGIANRLLAEKGHPQCDVFWNNEELRTRQLAAAGVFDDATGWKAFGYRSRRLVINTNLISLKDAPTHFVDLTNSTWHGKFAMAYPLFGTTGTHLMALRSRESEAEWLAWCKALAANQPMIVDGNSVVVQQVGRGEVVVGMTDFDDIEAGKREGYPIASVPILPDALLIPNTVGLVRGGPNPEQGRTFLNWLTKPQTVQRLVELQALESSDRAQFGKVTISPNWDSMLTNLATATTELKQLFVR